MTISPAGTAAGAPRWCRSKLDHVLAVARGGTDEDENLVAACFDCNRGKRTKILLRPQPPPPTKQEMDMVCSVLAGEQHITADKVRSIRLFIHSLGVERTVLAARKATRKMNGYNVRCFRYFCGVCWRWIKEGRLEDISTYPRNCSNDPQDDHQPRTAEISH